MAARARRRRGRRRGRAPRGTPGAGDAAALYDVPDAPWPDEDAVAPVRLLGEYDNVLLGHADRSRIVPAGFRWGGDRYVNNLLVDGMLRGVWWMENDVLVIRPWEEVPRDEVEAEARGLPGAADVRFEAPLPSAA